MVVETLKLNDEWAPALTVVLKRALQRPLPAQKKDLL